MTQTNPSNTAASQNNDSTAIPRVDPTEVIPKEQRIGIRGLDSQSSLSEFPEGLPSGFHGNCGEIRPFLDIIPNRNGEGGFLPHAEYGDIEAINEYTTDSGVDEAKVREALPTEVLDSLQHEPSDVDESPKHTPIYGYKDIIDPRRKALNAILPNQDIPFRWQIATDSYTIINPGPAYNPLYQKLHENGYTDNIFGWVDIRKWGGRVDLYLLFSNHTIPHPTHDDKKIYFGIRSSNDFTKSKAFDCKLFGYDPVKCTRIYGLGYRRSRKHIGDPNDAQHERDEGRTPIKEWWDETLGKLAIWTNEIADDVISATIHKYTFEDRDFTLKNFYEYLDFPDSYVDPDNHEKVGALERAKKSSTLDDDSYTIWNIYYSITTTLEKEYQGKNHASRSFKIYAERATNILLHPNRVMTRVEKEYHRDQQDDDELKSEAQQQLSGTQTQVTDPDELTELEPIEKDPDLERRVKDAQNQLELLDFSSESSKA